MNKRSYLLNRRRNFVLLQRHVRKVSLRHGYDFTYQAVKSKNNAVVEEVKKENEAVKDTEQVSKADIQEEVVNKELQKKQREEEVEKKKLEKKQKATDKKQQKALKKQLKKQYKEEELERLIDEPNTSIPLMIVNPLLCMDKVSKVDYATLSSGQRAVIHLIKWLLIGACFATPIAYVININPFGFSRMNFSSASLVAMKVAIYGFIAEVLASYIISFVCFRKNDAFDRARFVSIYSYSAPCEIVLFLLSVILMQVHIGAGIALFIGSVVVGIYLKCYGMSKNDLPKKRFLLALILVCFLFTILFFMYAQFAGSDVIKIFKNIMNL